MVLLCHDNQLCAVISFILSEVFPQMSLMHKSDNIFQYADLFQYHKNDQNKAPGSTDMISPVILIFC